MFLNPKDTLGSFQTFIGLNLLHSLVPQSSEIYRSSPFRTEVPWRSPLLVEVDQI